MKSPKAQVQFRYYETPPDCHMLALLGSNWIREYGNDLDELHFHNCLELGYCRDGGGAMDFGDEKPPYEKGSITVIPPKFLHHTNSRPGKKCHWEFLFADVDSILAEQFPEHSYIRARLARRINKNALVLRHGEHPQIANLLLAIMDEHRTKPEHYIDSSKGMMQSLIICLARLCGDAADDTGAGNQIGAISAGLDYVAKHFREKIAVSMLAKACHMSETHFRRMFMRSMHISPLAYVNRMRVEAACTLLFTTNIAIGDIALKCGFVSISAMNRNFREIMGMSPTQCRKDKQYYERKLSDSRILPYEGWR